MVINKNVSLLGSLVICLALCGCDIVDQEGEVYYISSEGNDNHSGLSPNRAWKTIDRMNAHSFSPGEKVLFRGGDVFEGTIVVTAEDAGSEKDRVLFSSFGEGRASIYGGGKESFIADSCDFLSVEKLEFSGLGRKSGNISDGLLIRNCDSLILNDLEVFGFQHSGVHVYQCNDATIKHVYAYDNGFAGIHVSGSTIWDTVNYDNHNLYIGHCVAKNNAGDPTVLNNHSGNGILASSVKNGIIEYCEASNNGWGMPWTGNGPVGIWIWDCDNFVIQYCIAHHNRTNPVAADGGGFDLDGGVSSSIIQYCISYKNDGAGFGLYEFGAAKPWKNNIVRYNISQDDGIINGGSVGIWKSEGQGSMSSCQIYNNTFYNSNPWGGNIWLYGNYPGFQFMNNVFVYYDSFISGGGSIKDEIFLGNLYWNLSGSESFLDFKSLKDWAKATGKEMQGSVFTGLYANPDFNDPGTFDLTGPDNIDFEQLFAYGLKSSSPLIDRGLDLKELFGWDCGSHDLVQTLIPQGEKNDIGASEYVYNE